MIEKLPTFSERSDELWGGPFSRRAHVDIFPQQVEQPKTNTITERPVHHM
jgi:predicted HD phosphohydrolase